MLVSILVLYSLELTPIDPYVLADTPLDLYCSINRTKYRGPRTAHEIVFAGGQTELPSEDVYVVNDDLAHLHVENVSTISAFSVRNRVRFRCLLPQTGSQNKTYLGAQYVQVASKYT